MRKLLLLGVLALVILSGCTAGNAPKGCGEAASCAADPTTDADHPGRIQGYVTNVEGVPLAEVQVTLIGASGSTPTSSDEQGGFGFDSIAPGKYQLSFAHPDYKGQLIPQTVEPGQTVDASARLDLLPNRLPKIDPYVLEGHYDCAIEAIILTGDCLIVWKNVTDTEDGVTAESNVVSFNLTERWTHILVEATWSAGSEQIEGLHVYLSPGNESRDASEHHTKYAVAEGPESPLVIQLDQGQPHALADPWPGSPALAQIPPEGGEVIGLVFPRGNFANEVGQVCQPGNEERCFLGAGVALDLEIKLYVSVFYNQAIPEGFTSLPPA